MNVLMMSLLYPADQMEEARQNARDKIQNQINSYQHAYIQGLRQNMHSDERLDILNALPVGIFPLQYKKVWLSSGWHDNNSIWNLSCLNLPPLKQDMRCRGAKAYLEHWIQKSPDNRTVLIYTLYLPYLQAAASLKRKYPDLKVAVIVTDLPNELGLSSGRTGLMKKMEYRRGAQSVALCQQMDGCVLLTEPMAEALQIQHKPNLVMEGLISQDGGKDLPKTATQNSVLYSGTLEMELGIGDLLEAFAQMPQYELWLCGQGGAQAAVEAASREYSNIRYFGFVSREEALRLQSEAAGLINPRPASAAFTRYSFPSKTLEYLRSGKPVLCYKLQGIPDDYDPYLQYILKPGADGIRDAVESLMNLSVDERLSLGKAGRAYVLDKKNPKAQCGRLYTFLHALHEEAVL